MARLLRQLEGGPVDIEHDRVGVGAALGQQLDQGETLEGIDGGDDQDIEGGGHHLGPLDPPEDLEMIGPVHLGRLHQGLIHVAQGGDVEDDGLAHRGGKQDQDDAPDGKPGIAQPVDGIRSDAFQNLVEDAVIVVVHPLPHHGDGHGAGDHGQVEDAAERGEHGALQLIDGRGHPQGERTHRRHGHDDDQEGILQGLQKGHVLPQIDKVFQSHELDVARVHIGVGKAVEDTNDHGDDNKSQEKDQAGQQKQITGDGLPAYQCPAHRGLGLFGQNRPLLSLEVDLWVGVRTEGPAEPGRPCIAPSGRKRHAPSPRGAGKGRANPFANQVTYRLTGSQPAAAALAFAM